MSGPLEDLRRAIISGDHLEMDAKSIIINHTTTLDRKTPTNFHSMRGRGDAYPLEAVYFQYVNRDKVYNNYVQQCRKQSIGYVVAIDKKDMLAYLNGQIHTCPGLVSKKSSSRTKSTSTSAPTDSSKQSSARQSTTISADSSATFASHRKNYRDQRSLDSVLIVKDWDFTVLRDKLSQHVAKVKRGNAEPSGKKSGNTFDPRGDRYTSNEGRFWRENLGSDFQDLGIDMSGSFKEKPSQPASNRPAENKAERTNSRPSGSRPTSGKHTPTKRPRLDPKDLVPIIIVPNGFSSLICHANAQTFLENARFESHAQLRERRVSAVSNVGRVSAFRIPGGNCSRAEYHIVFNPNRLTSAEWERVVAVVCTGQEWQFKNWPIFKDDMQALFRKVQGFYFHFDDSPPARNAELWPIRKLPISRTRRYMDAQAQSQFWSQLDSFLERRGRYLRY